MKLPFKLPAFKLPSLKLPSFGKKKTSVDDESEDVEEEENLEQELPGQADPLTEGSADGEDEKAAPEGDDGDPSALEALEDTMVDDAAVDDGGDESAPEKAQEGKKRLIMMIGAGGGGVLLLAGIALFFFSGGDDADHKSRNDSGVPRFEMAIAPKEPKAASGTLNAIAEGEKGPGAGVVTDASTVLAYAKIAPPKETDGPLPDIKDPALIEQTHTGPLPIIAKDGRMSWQVYAKSVDTKDDRSKAVLIITGLGLSRAGTEAAIALLPGGVTLAFDPYAPDLPGWVDKARQAGHEVLIMVPLEPTSFPTDDPGPQGLMTTNETLENLLRLEFVLSRMQRYVGAISVMGSKFNQDESHLEILLKNLKNRGLMFIDGSADPKSLAPAVAEKLKLPKAYVDIVLDVVPTKEAVDAKLSDFESLIRVNAVAVAISEAYPVTIERIALWAAGLAERGIVLAPASSAADKQLLR